MRRSIYRIICDNLKEDGSLARGFRLPSEDVFAVQYEPGAIDGIIRYRLEAPRIDYDRARLLARAFRAASAGDFGLAEELFYQWTLNYRAIYGVEDLHLYVQRHGKQLNDDNVFAAAVFMAVHSPYVECVKVALGIMELYDVFHSEVKEILRRLGACEEFTLFVVWIMTHWEDGNKEIYSLARKVHGWGRIQAVELLEPTSEEIRWWMMREGCFNDVNSLYTSRFCWLKSGAETLLYGKATQVGFEAISDLLRAMLEDGAIPGSYGPEEPEIEDLEDIMERYVEIAPKYELNVKEYETLAHIMAWAIIGNKKKKTYKKCAALLTKDDCRAKIQEAVKKGEGIVVAFAIGIPFQRPLLALLEENFDAYYGQCKYLLQDGQHVEDTLDVFRRHVPLDLGLDAPMAQLLDAFHKTQAMLYELGNLPGEGTDIVLAGLKSPFEVLRKTALEVIQTWRENTRQPISRISLELSHQLKEIKETDEFNDLRRMAEALLSDDAMAA